MKTKRIYLLIGLAALLLLASAGGSARALASSQIFSLGWWTVDGGGGISSGGGFTLSGTIGQADAEALAGEGYTLQGGFWGGAAAGPYVLRLPIVVR